MSSHFGMVARSTKLAPGPTHSPIRMASLGVLLLTPRRTTNIRNPIGVIVQIGVTWKVMTLYVKNYTEVICFIFSRVREMPNR